MMTVTRMYNRDGAKGALDVPEIKAVFNESAPKLGSRDCKVLPVSAISRCFFFFFFLVE